MPRHLAQVHIDTAHQRLTLIEHLMGGIDVHLRRVAQLGALNNPLALESND